LSFQLNRYQSAATAFIASPHAQFPASMPISHQADFFMRRTLRILALLASLCACNTAARAQSERVRDFHSDIRLLDDGTLLVKETITVFSTGNLIRHGIYREFPTHYKDRFENNYVVGFHWLGALCDGNPETSRVEDYSNGLRIYLGDKNSYISRGEHTYELNYSTNRQLGFLSDHDELYWNVTGNGWAFPIDRASASVTLPAAIVPGEVSLDGFIGPQGSLQRDLRSALQPDGKLEFEAAHALAPREGLSIVVRWSKGLIAPPTSQERLNYFFADNRDALVMLAALLVLLVYYALVWSAVGRDPQRRVIMPLYEPPANLSPAAIRYLVRMGFDNKTFAAAILDLAARGFLKIKFQADSYTLYRNKTDNRALTPDEQQLANQMFSGRDQLWLHNENHTVISAGMAALKAWLKLNEQKVYFFSNGRYLIPAIVFTVATAATAAHLKSPTGLVVTAFLALWLSIWSLAVAGLMAGCYGAWKAALTPQHGSALLAGKALVFTLFSLPFLAGEGFGIFMLTKFASLSLALFLFASIALHILFHFLLKAPTVAGRRLLDQVEGFRMFLGAVDGDRLNRINPPEQTAEIFEKFLPYALALDVEQAWAEKFSGVLSAASQAPNSGSSSIGYTPSFYSGSNWTSFSGPSFASGFTDSFTSAVSSSSSAPGSGDGGSGGGSGGGGGGGGGGGW
jgi:uncharacterized membrane protein YgcG